MTIDHRFLLAGVIGWPIMHSRSPLMHNHWLEENHLNGRYVPLAVEPAKLERAIRGLNPLGFFGVNVTIPHKQNVMQYLDEIDPTALAMGAVSCIHAREDGSLFGKNNDAQGFIRNIKAQSLQWRADAGPITVIGAGGGARAVCYGLIQEGATEIRLVNRHIEKAQGLADQFGSFIKPVAWSERHTALQGAKMLVNATSLGMVGQPALDLELNDLPKDALVADIIYAPLETELIKHAKLRGNQAVGGLGMLMHQGPLAWELWFGITPSVTPKLQALLEKSLQG
jgi:shikimate dehydrogenase